MRYIINLINKFMDNFIINKASHDFLDKNHDRFRISRNERDD